MSHRFEVLMTLVPLALGACADERFAAEPEYELAVDVDVNPDAMLSSYATFDVVDPREQVDDSPLASFDEIEPQLNEAIVEALTAKGLSHDTESPDLLVNPLVTISEVTDQYSFYDAYYGWYWGYDHLWTVSYEFSRGSLVIDVVDPGEPEDAMDDMNEMDETDDMLVYRGVAWGLMAEDLAIIELELRNAVREIFEDWPEASPD